VPDAQLVHDLLAQRHVGVNLDAACQGGEPELSALHLGIPMHQAQHFFGYPPRVLPVTIFGRLIDVVIQTYLGSG